MDTSREQGRILGKGWWTKREDFSGGNPGTRQHERQQTKRNGFHWRRSRIRSGSRSRSRKSASDRVKIESRSRKRSHKLDGIGVGRIRTVPFSSDSACDSDAYDPVETRLSESQAESN